MIALLLAAQIVGWSAEPVECCPLSHACGMTPAIMGHHPPPCVDPCKGAEQAETYSIKLLEHWTPDITPLPSDHSASLEWWLVRSEPLLRTPPAAVGPPAPDPYRARIKQLEESQARTRRMLFYVSLNFACAGADLWTTSDAIERGNVEGNSLVPTVEKRVGAKLTQAALSAVANWAIDKKWGAKAGWISAGGTAGVQCGAAVHNLTLDDNR